MFLKVKHVHFIGIGGIGMSGLAELLHNMGFQVSGSDAAESENTLHLRKLNISVTIGHHPDNIRSAATGVCCDVVVYSSAIRPDNPELVAARNSLVATGTPCPVIPRVEILAELMRMKQGIAVAGTHGKTTTTSMISTILAYAGLDPTIVIGGRLASLPPGRPAVGPRLSLEMEGAASSAPAHDLHPFERAQEGRGEIIGARGSDSINARLGQGDFLVAEADESDGSFLKLSPAIAVVTTLDEDHMEFYGSLERLKAAFLDFINKVPFYGAAVICLDQGNILDLVPGIQRRYISYGLIGNTDFTATAIQAAGLRSSFEVIAAGPDGRNAHQPALSGRGRTIGQIVLNVPGIHNIYNSLAATVVALELGVPFDAIREALASFQGADRRFQIKAHINNIYVVDDYGHHPTEIKATLATAKGVLATASHPACHRDSPLSPQGRGEGVRGCDLKPAPIKNGRNRRLIVIFQPHRYTRTRDLLTEFFTAFYQSDVLIITDIYAAGEDPIEGIHALLIAEGVRQHGHKDVHYISDREQIPGRVMEMVRHGDMILTLGAGDIWKINSKIVSMIKERF
jgi:UDP-N-acetylmuramate--alanine ligase